MTMDSVLANSASTSSGMPGLPALGSITLAGAQQLSPRALPCQLQHPQHTAVGVDCGLSGVSSFELLTACVPLQPWLQVPEVGLGSDRPQNTQ